MGLAVAQAWQAIFSDGASGMQTITGPLDGLLIFGQSVPVYARVPARQRVQAGSFSDTCAKSITL